MRLEVEIVGNTVSTGLVNIYSSSGSGVSEYVITDEDDGNKYAIAVTNGQISVTITTDPASANPIVEDTLNASNNWKIITSYGQIAVQVSGTAQDDSVVLADTADGNDRKLVVSNGMLGTSVVSSTSETFEFDSNTCVLGTTNFSTIAGITTSGISDGFISVRAVNRMGQPVNQEKIISNGMAVRFYSKGEGARGRAKIIMRLSGQEKVANYKIMAEPDADIEDKDVMYPLNGVYGLTMGTIDFTRRIYDFDGITHHTECDVLDL